MQNSILYGNSTTLPNLRGHYHRPRIDKLLKDLLTRHLIAVTAGAGSGKTHAVSAFLQNVKARVFWFQLSELDNNIARFWEEFVYIIAFDNKETSELLEQLGFPETLAKYDKFLHILAKEVYSGEQIIFVFDDFHLIQDEIIQTFIQNLFFAKLENFCVIINSRSSLDFNLTSMQANDLAGCVTAEDLYFTTEETAEYLKQNGIILPDREVRKVQNFTQGWPLALYLVSLSIKNGGIVSENSISGAAPLVFEMIEKELFSEYHPWIQSFLIKLSLLNSFPETLIRTLAGENEEMVTDFLRGNMFVYTRPYTGYYNFHLLFLEFLKGKQKALSEEEITETYLLAAKWCFSNDLKIEALAYYDKCGCHEEILNIMFNFGTAVFSKSVAEFYIGLIDKFPKELVKRNPLLHVHRAGLLCNNAEVQSAIEELSETRLELESLPLTESSRTALGEIYCMLGLINLGMANYDFVNQFIKAEEYIPEGSIFIDNKGMSVNTRYAIMLSSPAPGELEKMEESMFHAMPYASRVMRGYGYGLEYLASAEAAYFTGDMKKASINAYEAVYRAREKQVVDVACGGYFLLARIEAANGNYRGVVSNLEQTRAYAEISDKRNFNGMPDVADGWFALLLGDTEKIAAWLVDDTLGNNMLAPYSVGMERLIRARYLLKKGKYYELLAWLGQSEKTIRLHSNWLILLDILICKSIALHHIHDDTQAAAALKEAYDISHGNNLTMQFTEHGNDIRAVIYCVRNSEEKIPGTWLDEIYKKAATYEKHRRNMKSLQRQEHGHSSKPSIKVTKREKEVLGYLCQGLTNAEIAKACYITVSAVKKALNNIYIKLGATNRADAVRTAIQMNLNQ